MGLFNVLESALTLLPTVTWKYRRYIGSTVNELGVKIPQYSDWKVCRGMAQPVQSTKDPNMGLDFAKKMYNFWGSVQLNGQDVQDIPDQIMFLNRIWIVESDTDWVVYNGWHSITAYEDKREREEWKKDAGLPHKPKHEHLQPDDPNIGKVADWECPAYGEKKPPKV